MDFFETPDFSRELARLVKRYRSIKKDLEFYKPYLAETPRGNKSKHWNCLHHSEAVSIYKTRLACSYLRSSAMRLIYAYHTQPERIIFIELYYKGDTEREDEARIRQYLKDNKEI